MAVFVEALSPTSASLTSSPFTDRNSRQNTRPTSPYPKGERARKPSSEYAAGARNSTTNVTQYAYSTPAKIPVSTSTVRLSPKPSPRRGLLSSKMLTSLVRFVLLAFLLPTQLTNFVGAAATNSCPSAQWKPFGNSCYQLFQVQRDWLSAKVRCRVDHGGFLATVDNNGSFEFVQGLMNGTGATNYEVWIGLSDYLVEGDWRWVGLGPTADPVNYPLRWAPGQPAQRTSYQDCVVIRPLGLYVAEQGCSENTGKFYVCEQLQCAGGSCPAVAQTGAGSSSSTNVIIVVIVILLILILVVLFLLYYTWKYHNAKWELYVCYLCKMRESKAKVNTLQQENQKLRRQLSNQRSASQISLSGMPDKGALPDGAGGMLPTIRPLSQMNSVAGGMVGPAPTSPGGSRSPPPLRRMTSSQIATGPMLTRNLSNASMGGQSRPNSMSRQPSLAMSMGRTQRIAPANLNLPGGQEPATSPMGINSPRQAFVGMPTFASTPSVGPRRSSSGGASVSSAFDLGPPSPVRKKVSTVQEDPDAEDAEARDMADSPLGP